LTEELKQKVDICLWNMVNRILNTKEALSNSKEHK